VHDDQVFAMSWRSRLVAEPDICSRPLAARKERRSFPTRSSGITA
jgi:hypothetical protein